MKRPRYALQSSLQRAGFEKFLVCRSSSMPYPYCIHIKASIYPSNENRFRLDLSGAIKMVGSLDD